MTTGAENDFLQSMLEWERAPMLPICEWFQPKLELPHPDDLTDDQIRDRLYQTIGRMFEKHIVLDFTDHLTDRQLYCLIYRDILPSHEKMIQRHEQLPALGLCEHRRRSGRVAPLLRQRRRSPGVGRGDRRRAAADGRSAVSAGSAAGAAVGCRESLSRWAQASRSDQSLHSPRGLSATVTAAPARGRR